MLGWAQTNDIRHLVIEPGKPMQNGYIESFNGKLRDECLIEQRFETLLESRATVAARRQDYNEVRPAAVWGESRRPVSPRNIAGSPAMLLKSKR